jgi:hypothetical protein
MSVHDDKDPAAREADRAGERALASDGALTADQRGRQVRDGVGGGVTGQVDVDRVRLNAARCALVAVLRVRQRQAAGVAA